jgi:hypothetical protein
MPNNMDRYPQVFGTLSLSYHLRYNAFWRSARVCPSFAWFTIAPCCHLFLRPGSLHIGFCGRVYPLTRRYSHMYVLFLMLRLGGGLDGVWQFCSNEPFVRDLPSLPPSSILQIICRMVRHAKQRRSPPPDRSLPRSVAKVCHTPENVIDSRGLLPRDNPLAPVLCPSVFSPMGWVTRVLSVEELYRAFDIPKAAPPVTPSDDTSWWDAPPSKVLQRAFGRWATTPNIRYIKQIQSLSDTVRAPTMYTSASAQDLEASFVSAIKSDEAEIPVHLWNDRIWALGAHREELVASFSANKGKCPLDAI